jgi:hypothetical protein
MIEHRKVDVDEDALKTSAGGGTELDLEAQALELMELSYGLIPAKKLADAELALWVAAQRFIAQDLAGGSMDDGLEHGMNRTFVQVVFLLPDMDLVPASFGDVQGPIREADEFFDGVAMVRVERGADTHVQGDLPPRSDEGDSLADAVGRGQHAVAGGPGEHDEDLISTPPDDQVRPSRGFQHGVTDFLKDFVPGVMSLGIVQDFEVI